MEQTPGKETETKAGTGYMKTTEVEYGSKK